MLKWTIVSGQWIQVWVEVAFVNGRIVEREVKGSK